MPLTLPASPRNIEYAPPERLLSFIHVDEEIIVVSKPAGLLSVPGKGDKHKDCLSARVQTIFPEALVVHRLDLGTSGVFVMAGNKEAQSHLSAQFERRKTEKVYIARVWGSVEGESGEINLPLRCDWDNRPMQMVCREHGKPALTKWEVIGREMLEGGEYKGQPVTRMRLKPVTGRSHQLRVHMRELGNSGGHVILGDDLYAHDAAYRAAPRLMLHAESLRFIHPVSGEWMEFRDDGGF